MSTVTEETGQIRQTMSQVLFALAGVILGGLFTGVVFVLDKRSPGGGFWVLLSASTISLVASFIFGGRGVERIKIDNPYFNLQACAVLLGFICLGLCVPLLGPDKQDAQSQVIAQMQHELGTNAAELTDLKQDLEQAHSSEAEQDSSLKVLSADVDNLKRRVDMLSGSKGSRH